MYSKNIEEIDALILSELWNDPYGRGYATATLKEKVDLLNNPFFINVNNPAFGEEGQPEFLQEEQFPRIYNVLLAIPYAPNAVTIEDLERLEV